MVTSAKDAGFFEQQHVHGTLDDAQKRAIAAGVVTQGTRLDLGEGAALLAGLDSFAGLHQRTGELADFGGVRLHDVQGETLSTPRPDAGQAAERSHQFIERSGQESHEFPGDRRQVAAFRPGREC